MPEINQVIMLRPTESPIVFIQQLGRGLRKAENKEYVVVLDFIGNYRNNFMIPIALSGDRSYNKDNIRRYVTEGGRVIPGASTIHFDEISRKRIFQAIDNANFSDIKLIRENYTNLKNKLGHIPALADFDKYGEMDVLRIFDNNSLGSYYKFLVKYEKEYTIRLSEDEEKVCFGWYWICGSCLCRLLDENPGKDFGYSVWHFVGWRVSAVFCIRILVFYDPRSPDGICSRIHV